MKNKVRKLHHEIVLDLFAKKAAQSPAKIDAAVGVGNYSSKHIWFLRKLGHDISAKKNGRNIIAYVYNGPGTTKKSVPVKKRTKSVNPTPVVMTKKEEPVSQENRPIVMQKSSNLSRMKIVSARLADKLPSKKSIDDVEEAFNTGGEIAVSFSVDSDWDSMDGIDVRDFLR
jgi:hypothetical protein